ncbi:MAG: NHLP family bacteriocin export ABC transporter peptidase/permease/ATPase subunit [Rubrobacteraceae bacterium]
MTSPTRKAPQETDLSNGPASGKAPGKGTRRRIKTPTVLQMEAVECGAAALGIILGYYGRVVSLEELRVACGVSRDGAKAINIVRAARGYGLLSKGFKKEPEELLEMPLPVVAFWNLGHFLVIEGFGKHGVYVNDPATGPRVASYEEFDKAYTGIVITFEPGPDFEKGGSRPSLLAGMRRRLRGSEWALVFILLVSLALVVPGLVIPIFSQIFVDQYLVAQQTGIIGPLLLGMALTAILRAALTWLQQRTLLRLQTRLAVGMSGSLFWHALRLPVEFYGQRYAGEVGSRVAINDRIAQLLSGQLATTALNVFTVFFYVLLMFWYSIPLTIIGVFFALLNFVALRYVSRKRIDTNQRLLLERAKMTGVSMNGLQSVETLKATGSESDFFARWSGLQAKLQEAQQELGTRTQVLTAVPPMLAALTTAAVLGIGALEVMNGTLTLGMLVAFQSLMASFIAPIGQFVTLGTTLQETHGDLNRVEDVLHYEPDPWAPASFSSEEAPEPSSTGLPTELSGHVELRNVTFGYSRLEPPLIEDFNLTLEPGSRVALVGASGSGKSTVAKLVAGLYEAWEGEILFDGVDRDRLSRRLFTSYLAMVDQDISVFEGSVRDNLTLWDETIPSSSLHRAAEDAAIHEEISARPGGYESRVDEGGTNFSGGQRQRLEIARALVGDPSILIFDEATSALDPTTESTIDDNLRRRGCTCLISAHRLSTIRDSDEIIVLDRGKVVERGTHAQMIGADGPYARLIKAQVSEAPGRKA